MRFEKTGSEKIKFICYGLIAFEILLGIAHLLWPEYQWGQGRKSFFNLSNNLTLASWFGSMQLFCTALLCFVGIHREREERWFWFSASVFALLFSLHEITAIFQRFEIPGFTAFDEYQWFVSISMGLIFLFVYGFSFINKFISVPWSFKALLTSLFFLVTALLIPENNNIFISLVRGLSELMGETLFLSSLGIYFLQPPVERQGPQPKGLPPDTPTKTCSALHKALYKPKLTAPKKNKFLQSSSIKNTPEEDNKQIGVNLYAGIMGTAFAAIFLQIILFQILVIFENYNRAHSIISIALLGISLGGITAYYHPLRKPLESLTIAGLILPLSILLSFGAVVSLAKTPLIGSIFLMVPFALSSFIITVGFVISDSQRGQEPQPDGLPSDTKQNSVKKIPFSKILVHRVYFFDLLGAGLGALLINISLIFFREESSLFFLIAITFLNASFFIVHYPRQSFRKYFLILACSCAAIFILAGVVNLRDDRFNIVLKKVQKKYPETKILFSKSSIHGRYDIARRTPDSEVLKSLENGRAIDTIRNNPVGDYLIDPRLPYNLITDPTILIIGTSGDGITKTARNIGKKVYGVEINPAIVSLMKNELSGFNGNSYKDIDVAVTNGRSYLEQDNKSYDIITLLNAHFTKGNIYGKSASPEYLHTIESMELYLEHLTERGLLILEEPVNSPAYEVPAWKIVNTMREALLRKGYKNPGKHFFIFKWRTSTNNYTQILMKKNPFTKEEIELLNKWLYEVDHIKEIETMSGQRKGPILSAKTTILHSPFESFTTNYSRIARGDIDKDLIKNRNLEIITDNRPFPFDIDPLRSRISSIYKRTLLLSLLLFPFFLIPLYRHRARLNVLLPEMSIVMFTGTAYFLIEVVLIQRFNIFLGSPTMTFCTILGTMLVSSGFGSLWSREMKKRHLWYALFGIIILLAAQMWIVPHLFYYAANFSLLAKTILSVALIAPMAFLMGVPFPYILGMSRLNFDEKAPAILFALNGVFSAVAIPLALLILTAWGLNATFQIGIGFYIFISLIFAGLNTRRVQYFINIISFIIVLSIIAAPWVINRIPDKTSRQSDTYDVYAVAYGHSLFREDKIIMGGAPRKKVPFEWYFWVITGNDRVILVDTGFNDIEKARKLGFSRYAAPVKRLKKLGISPMEVTDIILTHTHWDHAGELKPFSKATVWIQQKEYDSVKSDLNKLKSFSEPDSHNYILDILRAEEEGRLKIINGENEPTSNVYLIPKGGHTAGSQYVKVKTIDGWVILASDAAYLYRNIERHIPIGTSVGHAENIKAIKEMHKIAASPIFIIPGHDPQVLKIFPEVAPGIVRISTLE